LSKISYVFTKPCRTSALHTTRVTLAIPARAQWIMPIPLTLTLLRRSGCVFRVLIDLWWLRYENNSLRITWYKSKPTGL